MAALAFHMLLQNNLVRLCKIYESDRNINIANLPRTRASLHYIEHKRYRRMFM
jgi:hypothetical protein